MILEQYTPTWVENFQQISAALQPALEGLPCYIEHVGSTAVPGLDSKPIIDIDIVYLQEADFASIKSRLEQLGYYHNGDQGIKGREVFKRNGNVYNKTLETIPHHLYVCHSGSAELKRHISFRDRLRNNTALRIEYQRLKYKLAEESGQNRKRYAALKEEMLKEFIYSITDGE